MSLNQEPAPCNKPIAADLAQLALTWKVIPIVSALNEVGVTKLIPEDGSGVDVVQLAQQSKVDSDLLYRYLRFVSALGVFKELPSRHFAHNESSKMLLPGHYVFYMLLFHGSAKTGLMSAAEYATQLREPSKSAVEHALQMPMWQYLAQTPELEKHFADFMHIRSNLVIPRILQNIELPETGIVADVGGGFGHVLLELLKANPKLIGIIYELPTVAKLVEEGLKSPSPPSDSIHSKYPIEVKQRVSVVAGSYTNVIQMKQISNADVFFFKWIFHDNNDEVCTKILAALYQVMKPSAKIIICDCVFKHTLNEWKFPIALDLIMAEATSGKERTQQEWTKLISNGEGYHYSVSFGGCNFDKLELDIITLNKKVSSA